MGGIRQRAHPQRPRQREHDRHATHCAQKRRELQLASASPHDGRRKFGARDAVLGLRLIQGTKQMCVDGGERLFGCVPQFPAAVSSSSTVGCAEIPAPHHVMEEKEVLDGRGILPPEHQLRSPGRHRTGIRLSWTAPIQTRTPARRQTVPTVILSARDCLPHTARTTGHVCTGIFCADSDWLRLDEELQNA